MKIMVAVDANQGGATRALVQYVLGLHQLDHDGDCSKAVSA